MLVCVGPSPGSARLVRAAHALAARLACPWTAAHVALPRPLSDADQARVDAHLREAESLGGEVARLAGRRTADTLVAFARSHGVTRILVGRPQTPRWRDLLFGSVVEDLVRSALDVEVHVTVGDDAPDERAPKHTPTKRNVLADAAFALVCVGAVTAAARVAAPVLSDADVVMTFLLAVVLTAFLRGRRAALFASASAVAAFNFFFVPPFHTFAVAETRNFVTFLVLFGVGLATSTLADRLRRQESEAVAREKRTATLLSLTRATAAAPDEVAVAEAIVNEAATRIAAGAALLVARDADMLVTLAQAGAPTDVTTTSVARLAHFEGAPVVRGDVHALPVVARGDRLGVLVLWGPGPATSDLADAYARQAGLALARVRDAAAVEAATLRARTEELRSALLSTVSHDLRTPLAAITGSATALLGGELVLSAAARTELLTSIRDEAARLERLVANLLEMTRLASGPLAVRREWVPLDEVVGAAFARVDAALVDHPASISLDPALPLVELDPVLFEHVLVNLLENAVRHTPRGTPVHLSARPVDGAVELSVWDEGPGFPPGDTSRLFDPFVRGAPANVPGSGLGLAICRGIVEAHGGTIRAGHHPRGGAVVTVRLPLDHAPPALPSEVPS